MCSSEQLCSLKHAGDCNSMAGYLYAVPIGYVPANGDWDAPCDLQLHVKLGRVTHLDPVMATRQRYSTLLGGLRLWWLEPSHDTVRDERDELFRALKPYRLRSDREVFAFYSKSHCLQVLLTFSHAFRERTAHEVKPPVIEDMENTWLSSSTAGTGSSLSCCSCATCALPALACFMLSLASVSSWSHSFCF